MEELKEQLDRIEANQKKILDSLKVKPITAEHAKKMFRIGFRGDDIQLLL